MSTRPHCVVPVPALAQRHNRCTRLSRPLLLGRPPAPSPSLFWAVSDQAELAELAKHSSPSFQTLPPSHTTTTPVLAHPPRRSGKPPETKPGKASQQRHVLSPDLRCTATPRSPKHPFHPAIFLRPLPPFTTRRLSRSEEARF